MAVRVLLSTATFIVLRIPHCATAAACHRCSVRTSHLSCHLTPAIDRAAVRMRVTTCM
eukprot:CAMPEP_0173452608 /NCGR_PEP_ID=MMETSP1357-20121228/49036_1 /TAXON_ID=77926 /ORGANISM="Hemiselmis rufescens, Strain PCC563" /LENGTH=57 /DNA_ID=CAMNT_0014419497 /DNA_START=38 /DNA_END=211 /DNA_ORIENTATION=+